MSFAFLYKVLLPSPYHLTHCTNEIPLVLLSLKWTRLFRKRLTPETNQMTMHGSLPMAKILLN